MLPGRKYSIIHLLLAVTVAAFVCAWYQSLGSPLAHIISILLAATLAVGTACVFQISAVARFGVFVFGFALFQALGFNVTVVSAWLTHAEAGEMFGAIGLVAVSLVLLQLAMSRSAPDPGSQPALPVVLPCAGCVALILAAFGMLFKGAGGATARLLIGLALGIPLLIILMFLDLRFVGP